MTGRTSGKSSWSKSVRNLDTDIDKCRDNIDAILKMDEKRRQIYRNPNTKVEVVVKTRKKSDNDDDNWATMLATKSATKSTNLATKSQRRVLGPKKTKKAVAKNVADVDEVDNVADVEFTNRTLQIFFREMRMALKNGDDEAVKILDDLEYVVANLGRKSMPDLNKVTEVKGQHHALMFDLSLQKTELKSVKEENKKLKVQIFNNDKKLKNFVDNNEYNDKKVADLKAIISRLTTNNNDMLAVLAKKVKIEDALKAAEDTNAKLVHQYKMEKAKGLKADAEIARLHKIIDDLKGSLNKNLEDVDKMIEKNPAALESGPFFESTVDLALSSGVDESTKADDDEDVDSALGDGISESQSTKIPENSFKPLDMHETRASSDWSDATKLENVPDDAGNNEALVNSVTNRVDAKMAAFFDKMRNDKRFQISFNSDAFSGAKPPDFTIRDEMTFDTDLESTSTMTEAKFRRGLDESINLSAD